MTDFIIFLLHSFTLLSICILMWTSIMRDLAQIRAVQKIEIESMLRIEKYIDEKDKKDENNNI